MAGGRPCHSPISDRSDFISASGSKGNDPQGGKQCSLSCVKPCSPSLIGLGRKREKAFYYLPRRLFAHTLASLAFGPSSPAAAPGCGCECALAISFRVQCGHRFSHPSLHQPQAKLKHPVLLSHSRPGWKELAWLASIGQI